MSVMKVLIGSMGIFLFFVAGVEVVWILNHARFTGVSRGAVAPGVVQHPSEQAGAVLGGAEGQVGPPLDLPAASTAPAAPTTPARASSAPAPVNLADPWQLETASSQRGVAPSAGQPSSPPSAPAAPAPPAGATSGSSTPASEPPPKPMPLLDLATGSVQFEALRAFDPRAVDASSLSSFVATGGRIPILLVTCDRESFLRQTLASLLAVRGVTREDVIVVQDGAVESVRAVVQDEFRLKLHQKKPADVRMRGAAPPDGSQRIAQHYGYAIRHAFEEAAPRAPAIIILEDDFLFAPDLYEYFHAVAPILEQDPTFWLASAWHDNGLQHLVRDPATLRRTRYFPGLGWMLPRAIWATELKHQWPTEHWDHWLRDERRHKNRDVLHPEVPRSYHMGIKGTFMDRRTHDMYFRRIALHADPDFAWFRPDRAGTASELLAYVRAPGQPEPSEPLRTPAGREITTVAPIVAAAAAIRNPRFGSQLDRDIASAIPLATLDEVAQFGNDAGGSSLTGEPSVGLIVYRLQNTHDNHDFRQIAAFWGIWHEPERGSREGVHVLRWNGRSSILLVNDQSPHARAAPASARRWTVSDFARKQRPALSPPLQPVASSGRSGGLLALKGASSDAGAASLGAAAAHAGLLPLTRTLYIMSPLDNDEVEQKFLTGKPLATLSGADALVTYPWQHGVPRAASEDAGVYSELNLPTDLRRPVSRASTARSTASAGGGAAAAPLTAKDFPAALDEQRRLSLPTGVLVVRGERPGRSCDEVCRDEGQGRRCDDFALRTINDCGWLSAYFPCAGCVDSAGSDQPAFIDPSAPRSKNPGQCLVNGDEAMFTCGGRWDYAIRLCPCV